MNNSYGLGFYGFYTIVFLIYGTPAIFLFGLPISLLIEKLFDRSNIKTKNYLITLGTYIITYASAGFIGSLIYFLVFTGGILRWSEDLLIFSIFGVMAALLFLIIRYCIEVIFKKIRYNNEIE